MVSPVRMSIPRSSMVKVAGLPEPFVVVIVSPFFRLSCAPSDERSEHGEIEQSWAALDRVPELASHPDRDRVDGLCRQCGGERALYFRNNAPENLLGRIPMVWRFDRAESRNQDQPDQTPG